MIEYRREIDGLRALAVVPVILFHAGAQSFRGGFVGVDIFFVISGYLITKIILFELKEGKFSILRFYERRTRRILPALILMMVFCLIVGYFTLMPDEFKNLGQSIVATVFFSNNILLAITTGYWDLAGEFKPLLHTWSLGVEEQYYVIFPVLMLLLWKGEKIKYKMLLVFSILFFGSLLFAVYFTNTSPKWAFYILPTRAWEILLGALAALYLSKQEIALHRSPSSANYLSFVGLCLIVASIFIFDQNYPSPSGFMLIPTIGAILIIIWARKGTLVHLILGHPAIVFIGLMSYSLYLWHQPIFAFMRISSADQPSIYSFIALAPAIALVSYLSWRFVEKPFRSKKAISRTALLISVTGISSILIAAGIFLNRTYGIPGRVFEPDVRMSDMDKRIYNERAFAYKKNGFSSSAEKKILIVGNSFGRDFVNMTVENFDITGVEIVYRDDLRQCITPYKSELAEKLYSSADVIVFASGEFSAECLNQDIAYSTNLDKMIYYSGTKNFGYNLNWLIRLSPEERRNQYNKISPAMLTGDKEMQTIIPSPHFISLLSSTVIDEKIPITDDHGRMLSADRAHLTKYGAIYFGSKALKQSEYGKSFNQRTD